MDASIPQPRRNLPVWLGVAVWLVAFFSPTVYFILLLLANRLQVPSPPVIFVIALFCLIPVVALVVCGSVVWLSRMTVARKIGWTLFTLAGLSIEFAILVVVIRIILVAATAYAQ